MQGKLTIKELKERWITDDGQKLLNAIISALKTGTSLKALPGLCEFYGRVDLRGIDFPKVRWDRYPKQIVGGMKFKKTVFNSVDFSYSDIEHAKFTRCKFSNCFFYQVNARQIKCYDCNFEDTIFKNTRLSYAYLNMRKWKSSGSFKKVQFIKTQFSETKFDFPKFHDCLFEDCNLNTANFDGSRFEHCKFTDLVDSPWFRKHAIFGYSPNLIFNIRNRSKFSNEMKDVDFTEAQLKYVCFTDDMDLTQCRFPKDIEIRRTENAPWSDYSISSTT